MMGHLAAASPPALPPQLCIPQPLLTAAACAHGGCGLAAAGAIHNPDKRQMHRSLVRCQSPAGPGTVPATQLSTHFATQHCAHTLRRIGRDRHTLCSCLHKRRPCNQDIAGCQQPRADDRPTSHHSQAINPTQDDIRHAAARLCTSHRAQQPRSAQSAAEHWCCP